MCPERGSGSLAQVGSTEFYGIPINAVTVTGLVVFLIGVVVLIFMAKDL